MDRLLVKLVEGMPTRKLLFSLALLPLLTLPCLARQAVAQEEGKPLLPPNLVATGSDNLTGFNIASLPSIPFSATIEAENTVTDAEGNTLLHRFHTKIARDSHGSTRIETDTNPEGLPTDLRLLHISIYDPVSHTDITFFPFNKLALRRRYKPAAPPHQPPIHSKQFPILVEPPELSGLQDSSPQIDIHREELLHQVIDGMLLRHGREMSKYPAGFAGHKEPYDIVIDYWYSQELQSFVLIKQVGPDHSVHTLKLQNIIRGDPDKALFNIPHDFKIQDTH